MCYYCNIIRALTHSAVVLLVDLAPQAVRALVIHKKVISVAIIRRPIKERG